MIERNCRQARRFAEVLKRSGIDILNDVCLNQVVAYVGDSDRTAAMLQAMKPMARFGVVPQRGGCERYPRVSVSWATTMMISKCPQTFTRLHANLRPKPFFYAMRSTPSLLDTRAGEVDVVGQLAKFERNGFVCVGNVLTPAVSGASRSL